MPATRNLKRSPPLHRRHWREPDVLVVNQGLSGQFHIFRGSEASEFLASLHVVAARKAVVILPPRRIERGSFFLTKALTMLLVLNSENLDDELATRAFCKVANKFARQI